MLESNPLQLNQCTEYHQTMVRLQHKLQKRKCQRSVLRPNLRLFQNGFHEKHRTLSADRLHSPPLNTRSIVTSTQKFPHNADPSEIEKQSLRQPGKARIKESCGRKGQQKTMWPHISKNKRSSSSLVTKRKLCDNPQNFGDSKKKGMAALANQDFNQRLKFGISGLPSPNPDRNVMSGTQPVDLGSFGECQRKSLCSSEKTSIVLTFSDSSINISPQISEDSLEVARINVGPMESSTSENRHKNTNQIKQQSHLNPSRHSSPNVYNLPADNGAHKDDKCSCLPFENTHVPLNAKLPRQHLHLNDKNSSSTHIERKTKCSYVNKDADIPPLSYSDAAGVIPWRISQRASRWSERKEEVDAATKATEKIVKDTIPNQEAHSCKISTSPSKRPRKLPFSLNADSHSYTDKMKQKKSVPLSNPRSSSVNGNFASCQLKSWIAKQPGRDASDPSFKLLTQSEETRRDSPTSKDECHHNLNKCYGTDVIQKTLHPLDRFTAMTPTNRFLKRSKTLKDEEQQESLCLEKNDTFEIVTSAQILPETRSALHLTKQLASYMKEKKCKCKGHSKVQHRNEIIGRDLHTMIKDPNYKTMESEKQYDLDEEGKTHRRNNFPSKQSSPQTDDGQSQSLKNRKSKYSPPDTEVEQINKNAFGKNGVNKRKIISTNVGVRDVPLNQLTDNIQLYASKINQRLIGVKERPKSLPFPKTQVVQENTKEISEWQLDRQMNTLLTQNKKEMSQQNSHVSRTPEQKETMLASQGKETPKLSCKPKNQSPQDQKENKHPNDAQSKHFHKGRREKCCHSSNQNHRSNETHGLVGKLRDKSKRNLDQDAVVLKSLCDEASTLWENDISYTPIQRYSAISKKRSKSDATAKRSKSPNPNFSTFSSRSFTQNMCSREKEMFGLNELISLIKSSVHNSKMIEKENAVQPTRLTLEQRKLKASTQPSQCIISDNNAKAITSRTSETKKASIRTASSIRHVKQSPPKSKINFTNAAIRRERSPRATRSIPVPENDSTSYLSIAISKSFPCLQALTKGFVFPKERNTRPFSMGRKSRKRDQLSPRRVLFARSSKSGSSVKSEVSQWKARRGTPILRRSTTVTLPVKNHACHSRRNAEEDDQESSDVTPMKISAMYLLSKCSVSIESELSFRFALECHLFRCSLVMIVLCILGTSLLLTLSSSTY